MKLFFKLFFIICLLVFPNYLCQAREIILITYDREKAEVANDIFNILINNEQIPITLITKRESTTPCVKVNEAIIQICVKNDGEVLFPIINSGIVLTNYKIFKKQ